MRDVSRAKVKVFRNKIDSQIVLCSNTTTVPVTFRTSLPTYRPIYGILWPTNISLHPYGVMSTETASRVPLHPTKYGR